MRPTILSFIDVETGGFDETKHGLLEVAIVKTDPEGELLGGLELFVRLLPGRTVTTEAFSLHGLDGSTGEEPIEAWRRIEAELAGTIPAGYNLSFDLRFLYQLAADVGAEAKPGGEPIGWADHHKFDLAALMMPAWIAGELESCRLEAAAKHYQTKIWTPTHRAMMDCMTTIELYRGLVAERRMGRAAIDSMGGRGFRWTGSHWTP